MKRSLTLCLLLPFVAFQSFSCSEAVVENSAGAANSSTKQPTENHSTRTVSNQPTQADKREFPSDSQDVVLPIGKDYIKKSGWTVPSETEAYVTKKQRDMGTTKDGKAVEVTTIYYDYKTMKSYSEDFYYGGPNLDNMKGRLRSGGFIGYSVNGKRFMYAVFVEKIVPPPASNSDPHDEPFVYQIMDADGNGIFETLLGDYDEIVVPNWVLK
ncbi:MAG: hypothetical protein KIT61_05595 [Pyrinomonadaceae bacterium]|nr:hypothetical protein [Pyrinomonadaceae bacterium]